MGNIHPPGTTTNNFYGTGNGYNVSNGPLLWSGSAVTGATGGVSDVAFPASSSVIGTGATGTPTTGVAGPYSTNDALALNGGILNAYMYSDGVGVSWEWCGFFDFHDWSGAVVMTTARFGGTGSTAGTITNGALYVSIGTADNLVVAVRNSALTADLGVSDNDFTTTSQNVWNWMCVGYAYASTGGTYTVHWPTGGTGTFQAPNALAAGSGWFGAEGNLDVYGYGFFDNNNSTQGGATWADPTNPVPGGAGGSGTNQCPQIGIISSAPKLQWCAPDLACNNFDTGWNVGADLAWLGCVFEQVGITIVKSIVNSFLDLVIPANATGPWSALWTTMGGHVPFCYLTGAWSAISGMLGASALTPTFTASIPYGDVGHGHTSTSQPLTMDVAGMLAPMVPWRGAITGFTIIWFATHIYSITRNRLSAGAGEEHDAGNDSYWSE